MKISKNLLTKSALVASLAWPLFGFAQTAPVPSEATTPAITPTVGEIKRVDLDGGKVTIKHGEIKHLDMPPMTMVFVAKEKAQLGGIKVGDKINFLVLNEGGKFFAQDIQVSQ